VLMVHVKKYRRVGQLLRNSIFVPYDHELGPTSLTFHVCRNAIQIEYITKCHDET
jgi:hypothetical protein